MRTRPPALRYLEPEGWRDDDEWVRLFEQQLERLLRAELEPLAEAERLVRDMLGGK
jgi:hypothetical protein